MIYAILGAGWALAGFLCVKLGQKSDELAAERGSRIYWQSQAECRLPRYRLERTEDGARVHVDYNRPGAEL